MQVGANGNVSFSMAANGDVVISACENDADSSETLSVAVHPAVIQAAVIKLLGGGPLASELVALAFTALPAGVALLPK